jgi:uncharacterized protein (TIGR04255 family)
MFQVATPQRYQLATPLLAQVLVQVRFPLVAHFQNLGGIASVQDRVRHLFPYLEQEHVQTISIVVNGVGGQPDTTPIWKFTGDDGWTMILEPGAATLFTADGYQGYEDFAAKLAIMLDALHSTGRVARCDRLGIRFVNIAEPLPGDEKAWLRWFRSELIGWIGANILTPQTRLGSSITQTQLVVPTLGETASTPANVQAVIRHGVLPTGTGIPLEGGIARQLEQESYVLDMDFFVQAVQRFDTEALLRQLEAMHAQMDTLFFWSLSDDGKRELGVAEV